MVILEPWIHVDGPFLHIYLGGPFLSLTCILKLKFIGFTCLNRQLLFLFKTLNTIFSRGVRGVVELTPYWTWFYWSKIFTFLIEHWILVNSTFQHIYLGGPFIWFTCILTLTSYYTEFYLSKLVMFFSVTTLNPGGPFQVIICILELTLQSANVP